MSARKKSQKEPKQKSEKLISRSSEAISKVQDEDMKALIHELQVHQAELEMQNDEHRKAQAEIEESRSQFSDLYDFAPVGYFTFSKSGEIVEANLTGASLLGIERSKLLHNLFSAYVIPEDRPLFRSHCSKTLRQKEKMQCELKLIKKDGTSFYASLESIAISHGRSATIRSAVTDITERKRMEQTVKEERHRFNNLLEMLPAYVVLLTQDYHVPFANRFFRERFGESNGKRCFEYLFGRTEPCETCETYSVLKTMAPHEWEWTGPDGRNYYIFDYPFTDGDGSTFILEMGIDITERKKAEEAARTEHVLRESIENSIITGILVGDLDGRLIHVNQAFCRMTGWREEELEGLMPPFPFVPSEYLEVFLQDLKTFLNSRLPASTFEARFQRKNGERFDALVLVSPLKEGQGKPLGWVASVGDISERKEMERRTKAANALLSLLSKKATRKEYLDHVVDLIQGWSGCRCVGVRVLDKNGFLPYESYTGFSQKFWESESPLSLERDQCACIRVVAGNPDPQDLPVMTPAGSFYCGNAFEFIGHLSEEKKSRFRGTCIQYGFQSISIVPVRYQQNVLGAIHLADERKKVLPEKWMEFIEFVAPLIGEAINRFTLEEDLRESESRLRLLSSQLLTAQENERKRISREIHDSLGQSLSAIKFRMETVLHQSRADKTEITAKSLEPLMPIIQQSIDEARRIQMDLRPSVLDDLGIMATMSWFCREYQETYSNIRIEKEVDVKEGDIPDTLKTVVYRIMQEALNNIAKHSQAGSVRLSLKKRGRLVELRVEDNGIGFDLMGVSDRSAGGFGLTNMWERAELSGGSFVIESTPGSGTVIRATWPV